MLLLSCIYVTSKVWITNYGYEKAKAAVDKSLRRMKLDYIDLMLLHKQYNDYIGAWKALEEGVDEGKLRSIGISSFNQKRTMEILEKARIKPVVNQVECHPYLQQEDTRRFIESNGMKMEAGYPVGHGDKKLQQEPIFVELAKKYNKSVVQIILRWHIQHGNIIFPKSLNPKHIQDNIDIFDFEISREDMIRIDGMNKNKSYNNMPEWLEKVIFCFYN